MDAPSTRRRERKKDRSIWNLIRGEANTDDRGATDRSPSKPGSASARAPEDLATRRRLHGQGAFGTHADPDLDDPDVVRVLSAVHVWPITPAIVKASTRLDIRADPADELIAATSLVHNARLLTRDRKLLGSRIVPLA
jgi:hypothetical protein